MRPRDEQGVGMHVADVEFAALEFGHEIGDAVALVIDGFSENVLGHDEPDVLLRRFVARRQSDTFVYPIQQLVENGHLFQIALVALIVQRVNVNLPYVFVIIDEQEARHLRG